MSSTKTTPLELYADVVCPWCWKGDRRLAAAIEQLRQTHPEVVEHTCGGRYGVSGAQPTEVFVEALQRVASE
jgi:predicted DsbA family dithiol-disulfide isomerase